MVIYFRTNSSPSVYVNPNEYSDVPTIRHIVFSTFRITFGAGEKSMLVHVLLTIRRAKCASRVLQFGVFCWS